MEQGIEKKPYRKFNNALKQFAYYYNDPDFGSRHWNNAANMEKQITDAGWVLKDFIRAARRNYYRVR